MTNRPRPRTDTALHSRQYAWPGVNSVLAASQSHSQVDYTRIAYKCARIPRKMYQELCTIVLVFLPLFCGFYVNSVWHRREQLNKTRKHLRNPSTHAAFTTEDDNCQINWRALVRIRLPLFRTIEWSCVKSHNQLYWISKANLRSVIIKVLY